VLAAACGANSTPEAVDIRLSGPAEARLGENTFEVTVMEGTKPIVDADVSLELFMAAMPSMNMPEMRTNVPLTHAGDGRYRGTGSVSMGGAWDANVMVMRRGQHLGDRTITIVAK
jgi:YtkA-like